MTMNNNNKPDNDLNVNDTADAKSVLWSSFMSSDLLYPYYQDSHILLFNADSIEIMNNFQGISHVITDPPFNAGKDFANDTMTETDWILFCDKLSSALKLLSPENILLEVGKNDVHMRHAFDKQFNYKWAIALNYTNAMRNGAIGFANYGLVYWYGGKCYKRYMDRIDCPLTNTISEFRHPSPKEIRHYERLVEMFSAEGDIILDPFAGSGTTLIAAKNLNRKAIGIEINKEYCDIIINRLRQEVLF